jgi:replicative DNA helicase
MKLDQIYENIKNIKANIEFMPTGIFQLDQDLDGGLMRKELVVIGGGTGSGKSFLAGQIFKNISLAGFKSAYFSLEISNEMVLSRLVGQISNIKPTRIMCGLLNPEENKRRMDAQSVLSPHSELMEFNDDLYILE